MHFKRAPQARRNLRGADNRKLPPAAGPRPASFSTPRAPALWDRAALVAALGRGGATDAARWTRAWTPADRVACVHYLFPQTHALAQLRRHTPLAPGVGRLLEYASLFACAQPILLIAAALSDRSPFLSPMARRGYLLPCSKARAMRR